MENKYFLEFLNFENFFLKIDHVLKNNHVVLKKLNHVVGKTQPRVSRSHLFFNRLSFASSISKSGLVKHRQKSFKPKDYYIYMDGTEPGISWN